ncbi:type II toxin-antitoxin system VapC family toxin [Aerosakkonema funiforme]|uniref:Type II toxin-antitoxin system VapC family toxin n=1 Tax=Aerosakkonema funiforme FACHB-1375 TaxID=2949571 RepID=A0A926ZH26_9CYAN|nr:type II toxin-antitoxin system VapC family toxin [Aerosakkonema funiforme]MBD2182585.1 type II toxin-antitoxin system VapC family toxin [Aerosakkonema funiforme FACHB-1375]
MKVVPDSNLVVAQIIPLPYSQVAIRKIQQWQEQKAELVVPTLWSYEVVSTLRKAVASGVISSEMATDALEAVLSIEILQIPPSQSLHQRALDWAARLNQIVAYDAAYVALAESEGAEFWTADQRLANAAVQAGASWVHHISESSA